MHRPGTELAMPTRQKSDALTTTPPSRPVAAELCVSTILLTYLLAEYYAGNTTDRLAKSYPAIIPYVE